MEVLSFMAGSLPNATAIADPVHIPASASLPKTFQAIQYLLGLSVGQLVQVGLALAVAIITIATFTTKTTIPSGVSYPWQVFAIPTPLKLTPANTRIFQGQLQVSRTFIRVACHKATCSQQCPRMASSRISYG